jgi:hypothetical protein
MRVVLLLLWSMTAGFGLWAQQVFFLPTSRDFVWYDLSAKKVVKSFDYTTSHKGILWRPTSDGKWLFFKQNYDDVMLYRKNMTTGQVQSLRLAQKFTDFQVIDAGHVVVQQGTQLLYWDLSSSQGVPLLSHKAIKFFAYDALTQSTVIQTLDQQLLSYAKGQSKPVLIAILPAGTGFTLVKGQLTYMTSPKLFYVMQLANGQSQSYLLTKPRVFMALWPLGDENFFGYEVIEGDTLQAMGWQLSVYNAKTRLTEYLITEPPVPRSGYTQLPQNLLICPQWLDVPY